MKEQNRHTKTVITAGFSEPFTAVNAIRALNQAGIDDGDIGMIGLLAGFPAESTSFWRSIGLPHEHASYFQDSFDEGGVLLIVQAREMETREAALSVLNEQGGILPPTIQ